MANEPHFETYPMMQRHFGGKIEHPSLGVVEAPVREEPTGEFGWRFQDANGRLTFVGGEGFESREGARRAIRGACEDVVGALWVVGILGDLSNGEPPDLPYSDLPIVDLGEDGQPV